MSPGRRSWPPGTGGSCSSSAGTRTTGTGAWRTCCPPEEPGDAERALRAGACGLYHLCCHNFLHGRSREVLAEGYKAALFSLRAKAFLETGVWRRRQAELERVLAGRDREVLEAAMALKQGDCTEDLPALTGRLLAWSREALLRGRPVDQRSKNG